MLEQCESYVASSSVSDVVAGLDGVVASSRSVARHFEDVLCGVEGVFDWNWLYVR